MSRERWKAGNRLGNPVVKDIDFPVRRLTAAVPEKNMDLFAPTHLIIILLIILVIFGPSKLGDVGGAMGKAIRDFKRAMNEPDTAATTTPLAKPDEVKTAEAVKPDKVS